MDGSSTRALVSNDEAESGWDVVEIDGHDYNEIYGAIENAKRAQKPFAIVANTIKGKGVSFMENQVGWHGKAPNAEEYEIAAAELKAALAELEA